MRLRLVVTVIAILVSVAALAAADGEPRYVYTEASTLTMVGKMFPDTPNPYHRIDTVKYKGFGVSEATRLMLSSGLSIAFRTDSRSIMVQTDFGNMMKHLNTNGISLKGFDMYIMQDGKWLWAGAAVKPDRHEAEPLQIVGNMDGQMHECLLYLPLYSEETSVRIGVEEGSVLEAIPNPFRHRVCVFGSSFTHGASTSRPGMTYPAQFSRMTGIQLVGMGCDGRSKLQSYFAEAFADADVDAFLFDAFSNPSPEEIRERLFPFIERIQAAHPGKPLIFQRTIYRERRNFDTQADASQLERIEVADSMMAIAVKRYKDVYYIRPNATFKSHESSVDGIHPGDAGYTLWAESIRKPVLRILRRYGIR